VGYDRTTLRSVAAEAGVDPALVVHFFGSKQRLFLESVELPFDPAELIAQLAAGPREAIGERVAAFAVGALESADVRDPWIATIRAAASEPEAARVLREVLEARVLTPLAERLGVDDAPLRAALVGTQLVGIAMARHIVGVEPIASADVRTIASAIGPTLQRYLIEDL
jgi:AcrR family transcriptional regulator